VTEEQLLALAEGKVWLGHQGERFVYLLGRGRWPMRRAPVPCSPRRVRPAARRRGAGRPARRGGSRAGPDDGSGEDGPEPGAGTRHHDVERYDNVDPLEVVARALQQVPRDPALVSAADLAQLVGVHAALAAEAEEIRASMATLAARLADADDLHAGALLGAAEEQQRLQARHGRVQIASTRLDDFTAVAISALGFTPADLLAGDQHKEQ